jgi:hypothetical protein
VTKLEDKSQAKTTITTRTSAGAAPYPVLEVDESLNALDVRGHFATDDTMDAFWLAGPVRSQGDLGKINGPE